jgi:tetratricopeptide (TPR) repeat protein
MILLEILTCVGIYISIIIVYSVTAMLLSYNGYVIFSIAFYGALLLTLVWSTVKLLKKSKMKLFNKVNPASILLLIMLIVRTKANIDKGLSQHLLEANRNLPVYKIYMNSKPTAKEAAEYNKLFKVNKHDDITIYHTDDVEPALKLIHAYLDKAKMDNLRLFENHEPGPLTVKFDYSEEVFKTRNIYYTGYAGVYSNIDKTVNLLVKDSYSDILFSNMINSGFRETLLHEYTHHAVSEFLKSKGIPESKIPLWFQEGICEYVGYEATGVQGWKPFPEKLVSFSELATHRQWRDYSSKDYDIYGQSYIAVMQMVLMKGESVIKDIILKTKDVEFNAAFHQVMGLSLGEFEEQLRADCKDGWKRYSKMLPDYDRESFRDIRIECLEKYVELRPDNVSALLDLADIYERFVSLDKAKAKLSIAIDSNPDNAMAWHRMALIYIKENDFDSAAKAFEKVIGCSEDPAVGYINLAHVYLLKDINMAVQSAEKARSLAKTNNYINQQVQAIRNYQNSVKNGKPYEGCLQLIKTDTINFDNIKKALIEKTTREYPNTRNSARNELERLKAKIGN